MKKDDITLKLGDKAYPTVKLNNQIWMAENLNLETDEGCWIYEENSLYGEWFGRLYTRDAAMRACPKGWHLPSNEEWDEMIKSLGDEKEAYHKLLESGDNAFNARFAGYRSNDGIFLSIERAADFWTSSEASPEGSSPSGASPATGCAGVSVGCSGPLAHPQRARPKTSATGIVR